jgi:hypothetical protein
MAYLEFERFWSKVSAADERGCRRWTGAKNGPRQYGRFQTDKVLISAHRWSYASAFGPIPEGMCVLHKCDVAQCVSPAHLMLGTAAENITDRDAKGRGTVTSLTAAVSRAARVEYVAGGQTYKQLAKKYGVSKACIHQSVRRAAGSSM